MKEALFTWFYFVCGFLLAVFADSQQMKKHVPYGEVPAILSLRAIRIANFLVITLIGTPLLIAALIDGVIEGVWHKIHMILLIRRLDKILNKDPKLQALWKPVRDRVRRRF